MELMVGQTICITDKELPPEQAEAILDSAVAAEADVRAIEIRGPGAISCVQGITTADIESPPDGSLIYGATLTPKGMIISDMWMIKEGDSVLFLVPGLGAENVLEVLKRSIPPRLARVSETTDQFTLIRLAGPLSRECSSRAGFGVPEPGQTIWSVLGSYKCLVARPLERAPFELQLYAEKRGASDVLGSLNDAGVVTGGLPALEFARILAGWPSLGAEIDGNTLPQEVRYDELSGISYTKGCYTGQETVARLHFRGHTNRSLVGLSWENDPDLNASGVLQDDSVVGRVTSLVWVDPLDQYLGIGMLKRGVDFSEPVMACEADANLIALPFRLDS